LQLGFLVWDPACKIIKEIDMDIVSYAALAITAYFVFDLARAYRAAIGTTWQRYVAAAKGAARSMWTGFTVGATLLIQGAAQLADFVNAPAVASAIQTYAKPSIVAAIMIASAVILEYAKRSKAS
jgi:hypothetical protein